MKYAVVRSPLLLSLVICRSKETIGERTGRRGRSWKCRVSTRFFDFELFCWGRKLFRNWNYGRKEGYICFVVTIDLGSESRRRFKEVLKQKVLNASFLAENDKVPKKMLNNINFMPECGWVGKKSSSRSAVNHWKRLIFCN